MTGLPDLTRVSLADLLAGDVDPELAAQVDAAAERLKAEALARNDAGRRCCGPYTCGH